MTSGRIMTPRGYWRDVPLVERRTMTIGIAAVADLGGKDLKKAIVFCSDSRMSGPLGTAELKSKDHMIREGWICLVSGYETEALAVVSLLKKHFERPDTVDETNVKMLVQAALNERKLEKIEELIQGKLAISYEDFIKFGKEKFPEDYFRDTITAIDAVTVPAPCIIGGFADGEPVLLDTTERCKVSIREDFVTVGEGTHLATASLLQRNHIEINSLNETLYNVYEAKKFAEGVKSVGERTSLVVLYHTNMWHRVSMVDPTVKGIFNSKYQKYGPQNVPTDVFSQNELTKILTPGS
jgi:hypothetical protein